MSDTLPTNIEESEQLQQLLSIPAVAEFANILHENGMKDESIGYITGKFIRAMSDKLSLEIMEAAQELLPEEPKDESSIPEVMPEEELQQKMEAAFKEKTGKTVAERRAEIAQEMLNEFKAKGASPE